jgi:nucleotide-binding universal stress UspA family protein
VRLIGAAFADTPEGRDALAFAIALARARRARVRAITVLDPAHAAEQSGVMAEQHHDVGPEQASAAAGRLGAEAVLHAAVGDLSDGVDVELDILVNQPADGLVAASRSLDLLVMGSRALGPRKAVVLGSVSRKVADRAGCPVLVLPRGAGEMRDALVANTAAHVPPAS